MDPRDAIRRLFEDAWSRMNFDGVQQYLAPEVTYHHRGRAQRLTPADLIGIVRRWHAAFPDLAFEIGGIVTEGAMAAVRLTHRGTHRGSWRGLEPTGRRIEVEEMMFLRFEDGRIVEVWEVTDELAERRQLTAPAE